MKEENNKSIGKKGWIIIAVAVVVLAVVIAFAVNHFKNSKKPSPVSSSAQQTEITKTKSSNSSGDYTIPIKNNVKQYKDGIFKVGKDVPAGEYVIYRNGKELSSVYFAVSTDSKVDNIVANDVMFSRNIITLKDGQYIKVQNAVMCAINDAPKAGTGDKLTDGMYKVGYDLKSGTYTVKKTGSNTLLQVCTDSSHLSSSVTRGENPTKDTTVTLKGGDYIYLKGLALILK